MARRSLLRPLGFAVLIFGVVWCVIILRWRAINRVPNGADVVLYLVALPMALLLGFVVLRWSIDAVKKRQKKAAADDVAAGNAVDPLVPEDPSLAWQLSVFAADVLFAGGDTPAALAEAARANQRAQLHPKLQDNRGLPVFAVEVEGIDTDAIEDSLPPAAQGWNESRKRTLALSLTLASRMLEEHFDALQAEASEADVPTARATPRSLLQIEWLLPAHWSDADRDTAQAWLTAQLAAQGWSAPLVQLTVTGLSGGMAALKRLDDLHRAFHADPPLLPHLLLASDSHLDETSVAEWDAARRLHAARRPEGLVPGEGACALLLAAKLPGGAPELARLHRVIAAQRAQPVDKPGRLQADTVKELIGQALSRVQLKPEALAHVISDTDMRASRMAESMHLIEQVVPDSDPSEVLLPLGVANGECGAALALAMVAVAVQLTADSQQPSLVFSHHDASLRAVALVTPSLPAVTTSTTPSLA